MTSRLNALAAHDSQSAYGNCKHGTVTFEKLNLTNLIRLSTTSTAKLDLGGALQSLKGTVCVLDWKRAKITLDAQITKDKEIIDYTHCISLTTAMVVVFLGSIILGIIMGWTGVFLSLGIAALILGIAVFAIKDINERKNGLEDVIGAVKRQLATIAE